MNLNIGDRGIDFSAFRLDSPAKIEQANEAGCRFVVRYSAGVDNTNATGFTKAKLITPAEFRQILAAGFDIIANSESSPTRIVQGTNPGSADGAADLALWKSCGLNAGSSIYVSWDGAPASSDYGGVAAYLRAYQSALGGYYNVDIYAGDPVIKQMRAESLVRYGWHPNAESWSGGDLPYQPDLSTPSLTTTFVGRAQAASGAHLVQTGNYWFAKAADEDIVIRTPVGSHLDNAIELTPTKPKGSNMLVISVDNSTLPPGTAQPGAFIFNGSTVVAIAGPSGTVNNLDNLLSALGQAAPVMVTYAQLQQWGGT